MPDHTPPLTPPAPARKMPLRFLHELESLPFPALDRQLPRTVRETYAWLIKKLRTKALPAREQSRVIALTERMEYFNIQWLMRVWEIAALLLQH